MGWKDWPYWLKGGILSLIVVFVLWTLIVTVFVMIMSDGPCSAGCPLMESILMESIDCPKSYSNCIYLEHLHVPFITDFFPNSEFLSPLRIIFYNPIVRWCYSIIIYFLLGALIGLIYGKIKKIISRPENSPP